MPCRDPGADEEESRELAQKVHSLTRMLCDLCETIENLEYKLPNDTKRWWDEHQIADRKRREEERASQKVLDLQAKALKKLTKAERRALGI